MGLLGKSGLSVFPEALRENPFPRLFQPLNAPSILRLQALSPFLRTGSAASFNLSPDSDPPACPPLGSLWLHRALLGNSGPSCRLRVLFHICEVPIFRQGDIFPGFRDWAVDISGGQYSTYHEGYSIQSPTEWFSIQSTPVKICFGLQPGTCRELDQSGITTRSHRHRHAWTFLVF